MIQGILVCLKVFHCVLRCFSVSQGVIEVCLEVF